MKSGNINNETLGFNLLKYLNQNAITAAITKMKKIK